MSDRARAIAAFPALEAIAPQLVIYEGLLRRWQPRINLVSASTLREIWWRHFADSVQLLDDFDKPASSEGVVETVDLGSGAGFPGLVLALAHPQNLSVTLIESDSRKAAFLREVSRETGAGAVVATLRAEEVVREMEAPAVVTSRAFRPLDGLLDLTSAWLAQGTRGIFLTGEATEARAADRLYRVSHRPSRTGTGFVVSVRSGESDGC